MKDKAQLLASIERFRVGFWDRERADRPPLIVYPYRCLVPLNYLKGPFAGDEFTPADLTPDLLRTDYEDASFGRRVLSDDFMPFSAAWRGVPWLEAACGCGVGFAEGALAPRSFVEDVAQLAELPLPGNPSWLACLDQETARLVEMSPADCWVSPTIIRGVSDTLAGMRGMSNLFLDLYDAPGLVQRAAERIGSVLAGMVERHYQLVPPNLGGFGHMYGYWAPAPTIVIQEDVLGLCGPEVYRSQFLEHDARIVERLGACTLFHVHSSGYRHYRDVIGIPGLAGLQVTIEANGPSLRELAPTFREILDRTRLMILVDSHFDELPWLIRQLPQEGLCYIVSDTFIPDEASFQAFVANAW